MGLPWHPSLWLPEPLGLSLPQPLHSASLPLGAALRYPTPLTGTFLEYQLDLPDS